MTELPISWLRRREIIAAGLGLAGSFIARAQPAPTGVPRRGGTLVVHMSQEQRMLNPALRASIGVYIIGSKIIEPLFDLGEKGDLVARLGLGGSSSADGKSITVTLRSNVRWHDGKPFTSADVQFCAMELWKKYQNYGSQLHASLEAVDTPDPLTAVFRYGKPMPLALFLSAAPDLFYVVPKHIYQGSNPLENPANSAPVGTGPYKFAQYERGQYVVAERNPDYWLRGMPYLDKIVWRFIADKAAAAAAIEAGQIHMSNYTGLPLADINRLSKDARFEVSSRGNERQPFQTTIQFNLRRKELADVRVRRAIIHAIDTDFFINNFLYGQGKRAAGPVPAGSSFFQAGAPDYPFNPARANALLDEAGFKPGADGSRFTLKMISPTFAEDVPLWCTYVQQALQQVAIKVEVQRVDMASYISLVYRDWN
jgi:peptide/nickel transport system substrate-binding protein